MLRLAIVSVLIAVAVARTAPMLDGRIVGGENTTIEQFPYQLSLQNNGAHFCGASILSPTRVLTAAHCTYRKSAESLTVRAGSNHSFAGGQVVKVASICEHPGYVTGVYDNDVSILRLATPLIFDSTVQPVSLVDIGSSLAPGAIATVTGWGRLQAGGDVPNQLQKVDVPRVSQSQCRAAYGASRITDNMICFGYTEGKKDSCQGDSGGPLVANGKQVGIVSWGRGCALPGLPGVYADVSLPHIRKHIIFSC